jgi:hypothetical protein
MSVVEEWLKWILRVEERSLADDFRVTDDSVDDLPPLRFTSLL